MSAPLLDATTGEVLAVLPEGEADPLDTQDVAELRRLARAYRQQAQGLQVDVERLERETRTHRRKIAALEAERDEQMQNVPERQVMRTIFAAWVKATDRNPKVAKLGPAREKALLARIREGHDPERILRAATIGAQAANVSDTERQRVALLAVMREAVGIVSEADGAALRDLYRRTLGRVKVYDDLELICRNEVNLERFAALADVLDPSPGAEAV